MTSLNVYKQKLTRILRLWDEKAYDKALSEVEVLLGQWPGNSHLLVLFSRLVQLQEDTKIELKEAKETLLQAMELDKGSPVGSIELGHYLDNVEDNPKAASKAFAKGVTLARNLLIEGLTGQARALIQQGQRKQALKCLTEAIQLDQTLAGTRAKDANGLSGDLIESEEIRELLSEAASQTVV